MSDATVEELKADVLRIEQSLDEGTYKPGPWAKVLRKARKATIEQRREVSEDISRVGNKLHRQNWPGSTISVKAGVLIEMVAADIGAIGLWYGAQIGSLWLIFVSTFILSWVAQPLLKMLVGTVLGVRYAYFYLKFKSEPRVRMQYGTYLMLSWQRQAIFHFAGTLGSVLTVFGIWAWIQTVHPDIAVYLFWLGTAFLAMNVSLLAGGFVGIKFATRLTSGGKATDLIARNLFGMRAPKPKS